MKIKADRNCCFQLILRDREISRDSEMSYSELPPFLWQSKQELQHVQTNLGHVAQENSKQRGEN